MLALSDNLAISQNSSILEQSEEASTECASLYCLSVHNPLVVVLVVERTRTKSQDETF